VLAAFDGSESDVGLVAVAEDILEHCDDIIVVVAAAGAAGTSDANNDDDGAHGSLDDGARTLLALLSARANESTRVWSARGTAAPFVGRDAARRMLDAWCSSGEQVARTRWTHPRVVTLRANALAGAEAALPLDPRALSQLASDAGVTATRALHLVHVRGTAWVAGCASHAVRVTLRGGSGWGFAKAAPFDGPHPTHDLELVFFPADDATAAGAAALWKSLLCDSDEAFFDASVLDALPGFAANDDVAEEEEDDDEA
jgi:hypothetical protein